MPITLTSSISPVAPISSSSFSLSMDELMARQKPGPMTIFSAGSNIMGSPPIANSVGRMIYLPGNTNLLPGMLPPGEQLMPQPSRVTLTSYAPTTVINSSYTAAAATATTRDEAAACIAAEPIFRKMQASILAVIAGGKDTQGLCRQVGLRALPPEKAAILAGSEIGRRRQFEETLKWAAGLMAVIAGALLAALVALSKT